MKENACGSSTVAIPSTDGLARAFAPKHVLEAVDPVGIQAAKHLHSDFTAATKQGVIEHDHVVSWDGHGNVDQLGGRRRRVLEERPNAATNLFAGHDFRDQNHEDRDPESQERAPESRHAHRRREIH
jgi:hypothetical protein